MQVTLSLTRLDVEFLERFAEDAGLPSIDEAAHRAKGWDRPLVTILAP